jgi:hypothetical protein
MVGACANARPLYKGERRSREEVAVLKLNATGAITNINGIALQGRAYELLPGRYSVQFRSYLTGELIVEGAKGQRYRRNCVIEFIAEAGHSYEITESKPKYIAGLRKEAGSPRATYDVPIYVVEFDSKEKAIQSRRAVCSF